MAKKKPPSGQKPQTTKKPSNVIFRRYRTTKSGKVLDAHDYGYKAWPIGKRG